LRKLVAFILICLLAFNWFGYRLLLQYMEKKSNIALQTKLDNQQFNTKDLVELRLPLNLPYITDWKEFETYNGETTINGKHYKYVKRKLCGNELILLCIPDRVTDKLQKAGNDFFKQVNDLPGAEKKSKTPQKAINIFSSEFTHEDVCVVSCLPRPSKTSYSSCQLNYISNYLSIPTPPPNC
jgi:hypothetical protein